MNSDRKRKLFVGLRIIISVALLGVLVISVKPAKIWQSLSHFRLVWLPLVFALIALSIWISALKWRVLLSAQDIRMKLRSLFGIYMSALFFNNFLPSSIGGDGIRVLLAGKRSGRTEAAAASVVIDRLLASISLSLLGLACALFARNRTQIAVLILGLLLIVGVVLAGVVMTGRVPEFVRHKRGTFWRVIESFVGAAGELRRHPRAIAVSLVLSLVFQIIVAIVVLAVIGGLGLPLPGIVEIIYVTSASSVLAMVPVGLNGYGLREGAFILLLRPLGFADSSALTVSVLFAVFVSIFSLGGFVHWISTRSLLKGSDAEGELT